MAKSTDSRGSGTDWLGALGWGALALGLLVIVLYGISLATPWSLTDPLGLHGGGQQAPDPARFQQALDDALDQAWELLGGHGGGVLVSELTKDEDRLGRAAQLVDGVLASRPDDARAFVLQGLVHLASDDLDAARTSLERSLELGAGQQSLLVLGTLSHEAGDLAEAEALFRRAVTEYPLFASAWNNLGRVLAQLGRQDEADEAFRQYEELAKGRAVGTQPSTSAGRPAAADGDR